MSGPPPPTKPLPGTGDGIPMDEAELIGLVCEGVLYGFFVALFMSTMYILVGRRRKSGSNTNWPMIVAAVTMMMLATAQLAVDIWNIFQAFMYTTRPERLLFLVNVTHPIFAAKHALYFTQMLVGDMILIYRAYVVWTKIYVIILPALCCLGSGISAYQTIWAVRHLKNTTIAAQAKWGYAVFALSLAANAIATGLIAFRIYSHDRQMSIHLGSARKNSLIPIMNIVLESGAINAAYLLAYIVVLNSGSHGLEIMAGISTPLVGIIFSIIIIRAAMATEQRKNNYSLPGASTNGTRVNIERSQHTAVELSSTHSYSGDPGKANHF